MTAETPEAILAAADADVEQADAQLAELEQKVIDGDTAVSPDDIEQARKGRWWAGLQRKQAEKKAAALREAEAQRQRTVAQLEARRILDSVPQADVDQAEQTAADAMQKLRDVVRARNDARDRALRVLRSCPAIEPAVRPVARARGEGAWHGPGFGVVRNDGYAGETWLLYVEGQPLDRIDEAAVMDRARKAPAAADAVAQQAAKQQAAVRLVEQDAALYRSDPRAFEELGAARRKAVLDSLGIDWDGYLRDPARPRIDKNRL
ncbi:hypothetical protein OHA99_26720 [Streptomyces coelicoflavus]|uniref:hypothetical protein n=1 Tax=Streptomyces coelicoflavus TaxID=285562 RepID=UPI00324AC762